MKILPSALFACATFLSAASAARADSATWNLNPTNGDWSTAANWTPMTVPNGPSDVATFATSSVTGISLEADDEVSSIVFPSGASSYSITDMIGTLTISGAGVLNNSGATQNFAAHPLRQVGGGAIDAVISFINQASAGGATYSNYGAEFESTAVGAGVFNNNATAANATFFNHAGFGYGGHATFRDASTAANAAFFNDAAAPPDLGLDYGYTEFYGTASADHATFTCYGATEPGIFGIDYGGAVSFSDEATAARSIFTVEGGTAAQTGGGQLSFSVNSTAANATITIGAGSNGGLDAYLYFLQDSLGGHAQIILSGTLDMSGHNSPGVSTGSIEGSGTIILGPNTLTVGSTRLRRAFSGTIEDGNVAGGSLSVIGGQLALTNDSTYTGGTSVIGGTLLVNNPAGSATGAGAVQVNGGTLGGGGIIGGAVTVNGGAFLAPAHGTKTQSTLTIQSPLTFNAGSTYTYTFKAKGKQAKTDKVIANGVTINSGVTVNLSGQTQGTLTSGLILTVISNTSADPISGTFSNLADGAIVNVNGNNLQASYEGGDGNDLTLTVVP